MKKKLYSLVLSALVMAGSLHGNLTESMNEFTAAYYTEAKPEDNYCFSPYSLFSCLGLAYLGAEGDTSMEMGKTLHLNTPKENLPPLLQALHRENQTSSNDSYKFNIANALWVEQGIHVKESFIRDIASEKHSIDTSHPKETVGKINQWVSDQTQGKIKKLLEPIHITKETKLVLTNAVYFKDAFAQPFKKEHTHKKPFHGKMEKTVDMMDQTGRFAYYEDEASQLLVTPMKSGKYGCFFILPKGPLSELEISSFDGMLSSTKEKLVHVQLPRFSIKKKSTPKKTLTAMGMKKAFSGAANFSGMTTDVNLKIDDILHEALFEMNEDGVVAAAATGIICGTTCVKTPIQTPISFNANKPFMFGVIDLNSGLVLFLGQMTGPAGSEDAIQH